MMLLEQAITELLDIFVVITFFYKEATNSSYMYGTTDLFYQLGEKTAAEIENFSEELKSRGLWKGSGTPNIKKYSDSYIDFGS